MLGATGVKISPLGIGTWAWGDRFFWGYGREEYTDEDLRAAFDAAIAAGVNLFDTAEVYGMGTSEKLLGRFARESGRDLVIATKFAPLPWRLSSGSLRKALRKSLDRLGMEQVDLYQIHFPLHVIPLAKLMEALAGVLDEGLVHAVGVSNYDLKQMGRAYNALAKRGAKLASNQVEYSLLHRQPEFNGVLQTCRDLRVTLIAYSPLNMGILTGKYTPENPPPGQRRFRYGSDYLRRIQPLLELMQEIGQAHGGKTHAQVAINWTISKGTVPIPGAKNVRHAEQNAAAMGWRLTEDEVAALDEASLEFVEL